MKGAVAAILVCVVMVLGALVPIASSGEHTIVKGPQGPKASTVNWTYEPSGYGVWNAKIDEYGLRSLVLDVYDNTSGIPEQLLHQRIRFAAYDAYPSGTVYSEPVTMSGGHIYEITATPNGPRNSYAVVTDQFVPQIPPIAAFTYTTDFLTVNVDASTSSDPDGYITEYLWDWGDDSTGSGMVATHAYAGEKTYTITLTVVDNLGATDRTSHDVTVYEPVNQPPVASFIIPLKVYLVVSVDASSSYDPDGWIVQYAWNWGDGSLDELYTTPTAAHTYSVGGTYTITLTVTDDDSATKSTMADVTVVPYVDQKPVAVFTYEVDYLVVAFDASGSTDDIGIVSYEWDFGDLTAGSGVKVTHEYAVSGTYIVTLAVTDTIGQTGTAMASIPVKANEPPVALFTVSALWLDIAVDASASYDDAMIASYAWDFGDGPVGSGVTATHSYSTDGTYAITLTVTDDRGLTGTAAQTISVSHEPKAPVAMFTADVLWMDVTVDATGSYDSDGTIASYDWNFGDETTSSGVTATHTYVTEGTYTITLTVTDNDGLSGSASQSVSVRPEPIPPVAMFTPSTDWLTVSVDASGSYDPDGMIISYAWTFGDGGTATGVAASHTYLIEGTYTVTLTVTDDDGMSTPTSQAVTVVAPPSPPVAVFSATMDWMAVSVDGMSSYDADGSIASYAWDFGDGSTGSGMTATHTYTVEGTYTITLTVTDNDGLMGSASRNVNAMFEPLPPVAMFAASTNWLVVNVDASGSYDPDGTIASYAWDFGDGAIASGVTASHAYAWDGTFTITLTVTDNEEMTGTAQKTVTVQHEPKSPTASFTVSISYLAVTVDGSASSDPDGSIVSYAWSFGDGTAATGVTASHTYAADGTYTITLTVTDNEGLTGTTTKDVTVAHKPIPPVATFSATMNWMVVSVDGSASSDADGPIMAYAWDFGDGMTASGPTATHTYSVEGTYTITLTVTDSDGLTGSASRNVNAMFEPLPPVAAFDVTTDWLIVNVDASASYDPDGTIVSYAWDFGDGATASGLTATHAYAWDGTFTIKLTVTDNEAMSGTALKAVTVVHQPKPPTASFTVSVDYLVVGVDGSASSDPDGTIASYAWTFGDGASASGPTASHTYAADGTYTITLTVTDNEGLTGTASQDVTVHHKPVPPVAAFTYSAVWEIVSFDGSGSSDADGSVVAWAWSFGDGSTGSGKTATHTYASSGNYPVTLTVTDNDGLTGSLTKTVAVTYNNPPVASFTVTQDYLQVTVDASGSTDDFGIVSYAWNFGDGTTDSGVVRSHSYALAGTYTISLTVTDTGGKSSSTSKSVSVIMNPSPTAVITLVSKVDLTVSLSAAGSSDDSAITSYAWDFGDGDAGSGVSVSHTYTVAWTYTVTLTVTDDHGATGVASMSITVTEPAPVISKVYTVYDMFMEPWGEWWPARLEYYSEAMIITNSPGANTVLFLPGGDQGIIYAPYRFAIDAKNWPGSASRALNIHQPEFMPVLGTTQTGLQATVDIYFQYLNTAWWTGYWIPTWGGEANWLGDAYYPGANDGYYLGVTYTVTLNRAAAAEWLNLPMATTDPAAWWAANKASYVDAWNTWISFEGNNRLDIYCGYAWTYDILSSVSGKGTYMSMSVDVSGNVVLNIAHLSWGYEVLMTRWLAETSLSAHEPWYEDFTMHVVYGATSANVLMDAVAQFSLHAVKATGTADGAAWVWEPNQIDYIVKVGHPSKFKPYSTRTYLSQNAGDILFGTLVPYEQTPYWFNLTATDKLIIQLPTGVSIGYKGVGLTALDYENLYFGDNSGFMAIRQDGLMSLGSFVTGWPLGTGIDLVPLYNAGTKTLTITGPVSFNNQWHTPTGVLVHGAPWIEFNVIPTAAPSPMLVSEVTVGDTAGPLASIAGSASALVALSMSSVVIVLLAIRRLREE